ncbi:MAG TPA: 6-phosphofructokinase, partial [Clostridiales bacterium]|nr:6-phosphofructokinase [Clostridiales bacterium]
IAMTDTTIGFDTALGIATDAIDRLHSTAHSHHRIILVELMGHNAGWLALGAGIAGGADVILIPEIPYDINRVAHTVLARKNDGKNFSIIVAAEAAREKNGEYLAQGTAEGDYDQVRLGGIGNKVARDLEALTRVECRVTVLGHLQRGGRPVAFDRVLTTRLGVAAVEMAENNQFGIMVALRNDHVIPVPLDQVTNQIRTVDPEGELVHIARALGVTFGD